MSENNSTNFQLNKLKLTSLATGASIDVRLITQEINVYEDVFSNVMHGDILISDSLNVLSNMPIYGYELLEIEFKNPLDSDVMTKKFRITRVAEAALTTPRTNAYNVYFSSLADVKNEIAAVSESYIEMRISQMAAAVAGKYLGIQFTTLDSTKYLHDYIFPNIDPFTVLNFLTWRANADAFSGAFYLMYENRDGYHFTTLENRVSQNITARFVLQPANYMNTQTELPEEVDRFAIQDYEFHSIIDVLENTRVGMYGAKLYVQSLQQKLWRQYNFDYIATYPSYKHCEPSSHTQNAQQLQLAQLSTSPIGKASALTKLGGAGQTDEQSVWKLDPFVEEKVFVPVKKELKLELKEKLPELKLPKIPEYPKDPDYNLSGPLGGFPVRNNKETRKNRTELAEPPNIKIPQWEPPKFKEPVKKDITLPPRGPSNFDSPQKVEKWLLQHESQVHAMFENVRLQCTVPGTTNVTVGDMVEVRLPSPEPITSETGELLDPRYQGRYFVANIRHHITKDDNAYYSIMELVKDSVYNAYPL